MKFRQGEGQPSFLLYNKEETENNIEESEEDSSEKETPSDNSED